MGSDLENCPSSVAPKPGLHAALRTVQSQLMRTHILPSGVGDCASRKCYHSHRLYFHCFFLFEPNLGDDCQDPVANIWRAAPGWVWWKKHDFEDAPLRSGVFYAPSLFQIFVSAFSLPNQRPDINILQVPASESPNPRELVGESGLKWL